MAKDPVARFRTRLVARNVLTEQRADEIVAKVRQAVEDAAAFAKVQPAPNAEDGLRNVFARGMVPLHAN